MRSFVIGTIVLGAIVAMALLALLYFSQEHLIFFPQPAPQAPPQAGAVAITEVRIGTPDGLALRGWLARSAGGSEDRLPMALYFGGNAEEVSHMAASAARFPGWSVLAVNYRGYGGNPGAPSERMLFADALTVYDWAASRADVTPSCIAAIGRSLGSGVAVYLAAQRRLASVVLVTPFDSLRAVAQRHYRFAPVSLLLKHPFDSIERAPGISTPMLMLVAQLDELIPPEHARALFKQWRGPKTWHEIPRAGHNNLDADPQYWKVIEHHLAGTKNEIPSGCTTRQNRP